MVAAHRGVAAGAAENTIEAFTNAIAIGADMIEFDVRMTRDGELIAFHDARVNGIAVGSLTRDDIEAGAGVRPPLLTEVLSACAGRVKLDVELKEDGYVPEVMAALKAISDPGEFIVTSFLPSAVGAAKIAFPAGQNRPAGRRERALGGPADLAPRAVPGRPGQAGPRRLPRAALHPRPVRHRRPGRRGGAAVPAVDGELRQRHPRVRRRPAGCRHHHRSRRAGARDRGRRDLRRLRLSEHRVDDDDVVQRHHPELVERHAVVAPVDRQLGVERDLVLAVRGDRAADGDRPGLVADGQRARDGRALARQRDRAGAERDVGVLGRVEEVGRAQVVVALLQAGVDGGGRDPDRAGSPRRRRRSRPPR